MDRSAATPEKMMVSSLRRYFGTEFSIDLGGYELIINLTILVGEY
jgi:hypothetical protein